jgi:HEAT repeat protein
MGLLGFLSGKITDADTGDMFAKRDVKGLIKATKYHENNPETRNGARIRQLAVQCLGDIRDYRAIPALKAALNDEDDFVKGDARYYLGFFPNQEDLLIPVHIKNLKSTDRRTRVAAARYLRDHNWTPENAEQELLFWAGRAFFENVDEDRIRALGAGTNTIQPLIQFLEFPDPSDRRSAAYLLGIIKNEAALEPLLNHMYNDPELAVREDASDAVRNIRGYV